VALAAMAAMTRIPGLALFPALGSNTCDRIRRRQRLRQDRLVAFDQKAAVLYAILAIGPIVIGSSYEWRYGYRWNSCGPGRSGGTARRALPATFATGIIFEAPIFPAAPRRVSGIA
jgi:hypothetical protein